MRKMSKAAKAEAYDAIVAERDVWRQVAWFFVNKMRPYAVEVVREPNNPKAHYEFRLYGALRADGGTLLQVFSYPGQPDTIEAWRFEDWLRSVADWPHGIGLNSEVKIAAERLTDARRELYDAERTERACVACGRSAGHAPGCEEIAARHASGIGSGEE